MLNGVTNVVANIYGKTSGSVPNGAERFEIQQYDIIQARTRTIVRTLK